MAHGLRWQSIRFARQNGGLEEAIWISKPPGRHATAGPVRVYLNHFLVKNMGKNAFFEGKYNFCEKNWESLYFEDVSLLPFPAYIRTTDKVRNFKVGIFSLHEVWAHPPAFLAAVHW